MSSVVVCCDHFKRGVTSCCYLIIASAYPCCDRCSDGLISKYFFKFKKIIFAVFDDLFSTITNYTGSDVTSADGTAASRRQLTAHSEKRV